MNTPISPYDAPRVAPSSNSNTASVVVWLLSVITVMCAILTTILCTMNPNLERFFRQVLPGPHMPDAFNHVNPATQAFMILLTISLGLLTGLTKRRQYSMFLPLAAGPSMCVLGWLLTENFSDPNWSDWIWITTIGMLVSCFVTFILAAIAEPPKPKVDS